MRRLLLLFGALSLLTLSGSVPAYATTSSGSFIWDAGGGVLCTLGITGACPDVAMASNGDSVTVSASGALNAATGAASGGGTFVHKDSAGNTKAMGIFTVSHLIDFSFYGCVPGNICGGRAALAVQLHPASSSVTLDGTLWVTCLLGSPPSGVMEGVRLNVNDVINFNKSVRGDTVFIGA